MLSGPRGRCTLMLTYLSRFAGPAFGADGSFQHPVKGGGMGGKRRAQPSGSPRGKEPAAKRQTPAAVSAEDRSSGREESHSMLVPIKVRFSFRCHPTNLGSRNKALQAALRKLMTEFRGREFELEQLLVGPSEDTLQRVLPLILERVTEGAAKCFQTCRSWRREMEDRGCCQRTLQLCSILAKKDAQHDTDHVLERLGRNALRRLNESSSEAERAACLDASAFLHKSLGCKGGGVHEWLQACSQEPDASFLAQGANSTAEMLGLGLVQWRGKPQGRWSPELRTLTGHAALVLSVAFSSDGKRIVSASKDGFIKIWDTDTGAEVSVLE